MNKLILDLILLTMIMPALIVQENKTLEHEDSL